MTHASVFSGIGGAELAATMLGWNNLFHCEINPYGRKVLQYWYPKAKSYEDITQTHFKEWKGKVDVLSGGFPCQPFSLAGKRGGADDDRYLWPYMYECIDEIQPHWVVAENVAGILTMVEQGAVSSLGSETTIFSEEDNIHRYKMQQTFTLERISNDLESRGYEVQTVLIPACAVGAPHRRDRVFIIAHANRAGAEGVRQNRQNAISQPRFTANASNMGWSWRGCKEGERQKSANQNKVLSNSKGFSRCQSFANTYSKRLQRWYNSEEERQKPSSNRPAKFMHKDNRAAGYRGWENFPTVAAVHRGNDGIPFDVDCLTLPFGKWRTESLKAYGNAIVPQVIYEIFRAIEQVEMMPK